MKKYYITEKNEKQFNAANKAREDIEACFRNKEYKANTIYSNILNSKYPKIVTLRELISGIISLKSEDCVYIQYPYYKHRNKINFLIKFLGKIKKLNLICVIHDIDSLRYRDNEKIKKEIEFFNMCNVVISHNEKMTKWLISNGCTSEIINIELFDYLLSEDENSKNIRKTDIVFAGNLDKNKSNFIYELIKNDNINFTVNLYGPNFYEEIKHNSIKYCGKYPPEELVKHVEGKFGLIWDGKKLDCCSGYTGEYTKYNNPHKLSLYIVSRLPIICWEEMAISKFVKENKIGICINSLEELNNIEITKDEYSLMLKNVSEIREKIKNGKFTEVVLNKVDDYINSI